MAKNRKIDAFLAVIKNPKLKDRVSADHSQPQFVDDYHATAQFIKEEVWRIHKFDDKNY